MLVERSFLACMYFCPSTLPQQASIVGRTYACCCLPKLIRALCGQSGPLTWPLPQPSLLFRIHPLRTHRRISVGMVETSVKCQSANCINGNPPSRLECPTCAKSALFSFHPLHDLIPCRLGIAGSFFCGQECFKAGCAFPASSESNELWW